MNIGENNLDMLPVGDTSYLKIKMFDNHVVVEDAAFEKSISVEKFLEIINEGIPVTGTKEVFRLPPGCINISYSPTGIEINTYYPATRKDLQYKPYVGSLQIFNIPTPNILLYFNLVSQKEGGYRLENILYFCTDLQPDSVVFPKGIIKNHDTKNNIWTLPFSNIYKEGRMCYGSNTTIRVFKDNLRGLDYYHTMLFDTPFNDDLGINHVQNRPTPKHWYEELKGLSQFPYNRMLDSRSQEQEYRDVFNELDTVDAFDEFTNNLVPETAVTDPLPL